ncbi:MAG TPA: AAA family ATPase, partial [Solirubrobacteraceae bacterium]|nr:AAA family ATPase [Solirubrobacteraceae bacterium]
MQTLLVRITARTPTVFARETSITAAATDFAPDSWAGAAPLRSLWGRHREQAALDELLVDVRSGRSRVLIVRGEAGIGKTALLEYLAGVVGDCRVMRTAGVESEMELAYAGLHQFCGGMTGALGRLPGPQREALEVAFGLRSGEAPDRLMVGLGVLGLVSE